MILHHRKIVYILLIIFSIIFLFQFYWLVIVALQKNSQLCQFPPTIWPKKITLDNFRALNLGAMLRWIGNSTVVALVATLFNCLFSALAGYSLARLNLPAGKTILAIMLISAIIPAQVFLIPRFIIVANKLRLYDSLLGMVLPFAFGPFSVYIVRQYCMSLSQEVLDAGRIDGASELRLFWHIVLPYLRPILAAVAILWFSTVWDSFMWQSVMVSSMEKMTAPVGLSLLGRPEAETALTGAVAWGLRQSFGVQPAAGLILGLPTCVLFLVLQRYFIQSGFIGGMR